MAAMLGRPAAAFDGVEAVVEVGEASVGLVGSLNDECEGAVDAGEPGLDCAAEPF
ncbi:hypothetical protein [Streptomyces sp. x-19]|uniref:hypothetical protein n=1 Tax=Streptomyces sp. x-19 TaxID=2789280 RepID=UPI00397FE403